MENSRSSYGQNAFKTLIRGVAQLSGLLAGEWDAMSAWQNVCRTASMISGKSIDHEGEGSHSDRSDLCKSTKESQIVINTVESHHGDEEPQSLIACIVQAADATPQQDRVQEEESPLENIYQQIKTVGRHHEFVQGCRKSLLFRLVEKSASWLFLSRYPILKMVLPARDISKQSKLNWKYPDRSRSICYPREPRNGLREIKDFLRNNLITKSRRLWT